MKFMQNLLAPFIFQEECRMKIEHVLFPSAFQNHGSMCRMVIFTVSRHCDFWNQQNQILEIRSCERVFRDAMEYNYI